MFQCQSATIGIYLMRLIERVRAGTTILTRLSRSDILHVHFLNLSTASTTPGLTPGVVAIVDHAAGCRKLSRLVDQ